MYETNPRLHLVHHLRMASGELGPGKSTKGAEGLTRECMKEAIAVTEYDTYKE